MDPNQNQGGGAPTDAPATDQPVVDPNAPVAPTDAPAADPMGTPAPEATPETPAPDTSGGDQGGMGGGTGTV